VKATRIASRCAAALAVFATIAMSTGAAWLAYEALFGAGVNRVAIDFVRSLGRLGGVVSGLDPIVALVVLPPAVIGAVALVSLIVWNRYGN
jgi:hypothetical protein